MVVISGEDFLREKLRCQGGGPAWEQVGEYGWEYIDKTENVRNFELPPRISRRKWSEVTL